MPVDRHFPVNGPVLRCAKACSADRATDVVPIGRQLEKSLAQERFEHRRLDVSAEFPQLLDLVFRQAQPGDVEEFAPNDLRPLAFRGKGVSHDDGGSLKPRDVIPAVQYPYRVLVGAAFRKPERSPDMSEKLRSGVWLGSRLTASQTVRPRKRPQLAPTFSGPTCVGRDFVRPGARHIEGAT